MALSTGFDETKVVAAMTGLLGWINPTKSGYSVVGSGNQSSTVGRYYNDGSFHAACTIENLKETQEDPEISDSDLNTLLTVLERSNILSTVNAVFDKTEAIESGLLFRRSALPASFTPTTVTGTNKFVGVRIHVGRGDFAVSVDTVTLLLDSAVTLNIYVYKDMKQAPLATKEITTAAYEEVSVDVGTVLNDLSSTNKGGCYYVGYYQKDLQGAKALDCSPYPCCDFKIFGFTSIESAEDVSFGFNRFNYSTSYQSYGLNVEMSSYRDYTDTIIKGKHQFVECLGLKMAAMIIEQMTNTQRSNGAERQGGINVQKLHEDLQAPDRTEGLPIGPGLKSKLQKELKRLKSVFHQEPKPISISC